jgi:hypothetical protein
MVYGCGGDLAKDEWDLSQNGWEFAERFKNADCLSNDIVQGLIHLFRQKINLRWLLVVRHTYIAREAMLYCSWTCPLSYGKLMHLQPAKNAGMYDAYDVRSCCHRLSATCAGPATFTSFASAGPAKLTAANGVALPCRLQPAAQTTSQSLPAALWLFIRNEWPKKPKLCDPTKAPNCRGILEQVTFKKHVYSWVGFSMLYIFFVRTSDSVFCLKKCHENPACIFLSRST